MDYLQMIRTEWGIAVAAFLLVVLVIAIVDLKTKYIYDWMLIAGALLSYPLLLWHRGELSGDWLNGVIRILIGAAVGFAFYGIIYLVARLIYKREAFGLGDVFFNAFLCGFLGWERGLIASFLSFYIALIFVLLSAAKTKKLDTQSELPFGPSMAVAALITMVFYYDIIGLIFP
ncbi:MAG: A24 family peptidase [Bacillota bacterium]|nr:A24 family peptidase [Bacillota bacterium]